MDNTNKVYNIDDFETVISNTSTISTNITSTADAIDTVVTGVDRRVYDYYNFFKDLSDKSQTLRLEETTATNFGTWMSDSYTEFMGVKATVDGMSGTGTTDLTLAEAAAEFPSINVDPSKTTPYDLTSDAWENLSTEDKKAVEAKLKELGFTDEEIQAIKDGNASVNKITHEKLSGALEKLNNQGTDVRQVILEKYGFDIFNEDGTVDPDKLALAMLIDNKNPNDDYDLVNLLKTKYGIDLFPNTSTTTTTTGGPTNVTPEPTDTTTTTPPPTDTSTPTTVHTGLSFGGDSTGDGTGTGVPTVDTSEIQNMLDGESGSLLDGLGNLTGSVLGGKDGFDIGFSGDGAKGNALGLATGAGIAGLGLAATAGLLAKKKREKDLVDGEDDDDDFDDDFDGDLDLSLDEEELFGKDALFASASDLGSGKGDGNGNGKGANGLAGAVDGANGGNGADGESSSLDVTKKKKQWLYGLGIGLAGSGLAAGLIAKDDDDEDDDDDDDF